MKLDLFDKKLLFYLDLNSRSSLIELSKKIRLSKQTVHYRLKNLEKKGIIKTYYTLINFNKLGYTQFKLYFKFINADQEKINEIIDYWSKKHSIWIGSCYGNYDLAVSLLVYDLDIFNKDYSEFLNFYSEYILDKSFLISLKSSFFSRRHLIDFYDRKEFFYKSSKKEEYTLDDVEIKILKHISNNARISVVDLMKKTSLSKDVVIYRLKKLEKNNIIEQYRVLIDLKINIYKITLKLRKFNDEIFNSLKKFVLNNKYGIQIIYLIGNWDCEFEFEAESEEGIQKILFELKNNFSDIILDYDIIRVYKSNKMDFFPF